MSARSIRRSHEREAAREGRRAGLRLGRTLLTTGVALGGAAAVAPAAHAAVFPVSNTANAGLGSLRDAVASANVNPGLDSVTFTGAGASGEITLTTGQIAITDDLTITGPGAGALSVSGDANNDNLRTYATNISPGDSRIFRITDPSAPGSPVQQVSITGLTLKEGVASEYSAPDFYARDGGAIDSRQTDLSLSNVTLTDNAATGEGGGIFQESGSLIVSSSRVVGNRTLRSGGGIASSGDKYSTPPQGTVIAGSEVTGNSAGGAVPNFSTSTNPTGGGLSLRGEADVVGTTIAANTAINATLAPGGSGGGVLLTGGGLIRDSVMSGNFAERAGGGALLLGGKIRSSTVSGNSATISGGGVHAQKYIGGPSRIDNATISGNQATDATDGVGGGISAFSYGGGDSTLILRNSTVAANTAATEGGGIYNLSENPSNDAAIVLKSSLVADNSAPGAGDDLGELESGSFSAGFSLVEAPGAASIFGDPSGTNVVGVDPLLGPLADNGGPTRTHAISPLSAALDAAQANGFTTDQRGQPRTVNAASTNNSISDGTDIGAFELADATAAGDDPDTAFTKQPKKKVKLKEGKKTRKVKFVFSGTDNAPPPGPLTFECSVDGAKFDECSSPLKLTLDKGKHTVEVRAVDADGNVDSTPAEATVKLKAKKKKKKG